MCKFFIIFLLFFKGIGKIMVNGGVGGGNLGGGVGGRIVVYFIENIIYIGFF